MNDPENKECPPTATANAATSCASRFPPSSRVARPVRTMTRPCDSAAKSLNPLSEARRVPIPRGQETASPGDRPSSPRPLLLCSCKIRRCLWSQFRELLQLDAGMIIREQGGLLCTHQYPSNDANLQEERCALQGQFSQFKSKTTRLGILRRDGLRGSAFVGRLPATWPTTEFAHHGERECRQPAGHGK